MKSTLKWFKLKCCSLWICYQSESGSCHLLHFPPLCKPLPISSSIFLSLHHHGKVVCKHLSPGFVLIEAFSKPVQPQKRGYWWKRNAQQSLETWLHSLYFAKPINIWVPLARNTHFAVVQKVIPLRRDFVQQTESLCWAVRYTLSVEDCFVQQSVLGHSFSGGIKWACNWLLGFLHTQLQIIFENKVRLLLKPHPERYVLATCTSQNLTRFVKWRTTLHWTLCSQELVIDLPSGHKGALCGRETGYWVTKAGRVALCTAWKTLLEIKQSTKFVLTLTLLKRLVLYNMTLKL